MLRGIAGFPKPNKVRLCCDVTAIRGGVYGGRKFRDILIEAFSNRDGR